MEKLNEIHPDVEVHFIIHEGAYVKFPKVVAQRALNYLNHLVCPETVAGYLSIKELFDSTQDNGLEPIWDKIKSGVELVLWSEYYEAYANNPNHQPFINMIDLEYYSNTPDLSEIYSTLQASPGYQEMIGLQMRNLFNSAQSPIMVQSHEFSLWAKRHASPVAQREFDKRFGLVMVPSK